MPVYVLLLTFMCSTFSTWSVIGSSEMQFCALQISEFCETHVTPNLFCFWGPMLTESCQARSSGWWKGLSDFWFSLCSSPRLCPFLLLLGPESSQIWWESFEPQEVRQKLQLFWTESSRRPKKNFSSVSWPISATQLHAFSVKVSKISERNHLYTNPVKHLPSSIFHLPTQFLMRIVEATLS